MSGYMRGVPRGEHRDVPLDGLITSDAAMREVLASGRVSGTPDVPVSLTMREDGAGLEIADGHHRVADAIRRGHTHVRAYVENYVDDEPYERPFYDFRPHMR